MTRPSIKLKFQRLVEHAEIPKYTREGDAALDLVAVDLYHDQEFGFIEYGTGIAVEIPPGHVGLLFARSSLSKKDLFLTNGVGVIDSNYRGELKFRYKPTKENAEEYYVGDRVGQLLVVPCPNLELEEVTSLSETNRGSEGFGSSGN